jgi:hypothetical protein
MTTVCSATLCSGFANQQEKNFLSLPPRPNQLCKTTCLVSRYGELFLYRPSCRSLQLTGYFHLVTRRRTCGYTIFHPHAFLEQCLIKEMEGLAFTNFIRERVVYPRKAASIWTWNAWSVLRGKNLNFWNEIYCGNKMSREKIVQSRRSQLIFLMWYYKKQQEMGYVCST